MSAVVATPARSNWSIRIGAGATAIVASGSAVLSWDALSWGAGQLGVDPRLTWLYPVVIDGTIAVGTVAALALRGAIPRIRAYVWALLVGAIGASVVGNGAHAAGGSLIHVVGAAVPAVALAASLHLLVILVRHAPANAVEPGDLVAEVVPPPAAVPSPAPTPAALASTGADDVREHAEEPSADVVEVPPAPAPASPPAPSASTKRASRPRKPASKRASTSARSALEQGPRMPAGDVRALVRAARDHVLADADRPADRPLDDLVGEHLTAGGHPLSRSRVRTYLAELRRESADGPAPARRPRVVHLEAVPAAASANAGEA